MIYFCYKRLLYLINNLNVLRNMQLFLWALSAALFSHLVAFMGMNYFGGQIYVSFYLLISIISRATDITETSIINNNALKI